MKILLPRVGRFTALHDRFCVSVVRLEIIISPPPRFYARVNVVRYKSLYVADELS